MEIQVELLTYIGSKAWRKPCDFKWRQYVRVPKYRDADDINDVATIFMRRSKHSQV